MNVEQLIGRHLRLREEVALAASSVPWNAGHVDRLTAELVAVEHQLEMVRANSQSGNDATQRFPFFPLPRGERAR